MGIKRSLALACLLLAAACAAPKHKPEHIAEGLRLYTMECGRMEISDLKDFADDHSYDGQKATLTDSCYLIRHPKGDLVWDAGIPDWLHWIPNGIKKDVYHVTVPRTLKSQLREIGINPKHVDYFAMSHAHFDHTGNANYFGGTPKWLVEKVEYDWMFGEGPELGLTRPGSYKKLKDNPRIDLQGDFDVFGDGSVQIVFTPGHTPGHASLLVKLPHMGNVLLTGDLYHLEASRTHRRVPVFNTSKEETLHSMDKFEALAKQYDALVVIQHSEQDFKLMPVFPAYAD